MNKEQYAALLLTVEWKDRRKKILKLDNNTCIGCNSTKNLCIHHLYYEGGKKPWNYPNKCLVTLCNECHYKEHFGKDISEFTIENSKDPSYFPFFNRNSNKNTHKKVKFKPLGLGIRNVKKVLHTYGVKYVEGSIPYSMRYTKDRKIVNCDFFIPNGGMRRDFVIQFKRPDNRKVESRIKLLCLRLNTKLVEIDINNYDNAISISRDIYSILQNNKVLPP